MSIIAAAAVLLAGCNSVSKTTLLTGTVDENGPSAIMITVPGIGLDTTVALTDGQFKVEIPTDTKAYGRLACGDYHMLFIPDGTNIDFDFVGATDEFPPVVTSSKPSKSIQERLNKVKSGLDEFYKEYSEKQDWTPEEEKEFMDRYNKYSVDAAKANKDNAISLLMVQGLVGELDNDEMSNLLAELSPEIAATPEIVSLKESLEAAKKTAEGQKFTDFEIQQPDGSVKKLSDYVGNGKYVLADFWASWCGPCKREIPFIKAAYDKYHGDNFNVVSIAVWDKPEDTAKAAEEHGVVWDQIVNAQKVPTDLYGIEGIPHLILFGPDGTILKRGEVLRGESLDKTLSEYLK